MQLAEDDSEVLSWVTGAYLPLDENFDDSIVLVDRSITLNPGSSLAWLMSGWLRAAAGDADRAVEHFEMSMRLDPCSSDRGYQLSGMPWQDSASVDMRKRRRCSRSHCNSSPRSRSTRGNSTTE